MNHRKSAAAWAAITCAAVLSAATAKAGGDKVAFPENYAKGVLYATVDRADNKQYRELYASPPEAIAAAKKGEPLPHGTVLTLVQYAPAGAPSIPSRYETESGSTRHSAPTSRSTPAPSWRTASPATSRSARRWITSSPTTR